MLFKNKRKGLFCIVFLLLAVMTMSMSTASIQGKQKNVTIKVAFYPLDGFFEYDEKGNECGYGVDYLNELSKYADITWKYIKVDSWEKIGAMIQSGEADVEMPVSEPKTESPKYSYTTEPIMNTYHAIMTMKSRTDLYYKDYDGFSKLKVGVCREFLDKTGMNDYLKTVGVWKNIVYYDDYNSAKQELKNGRIDAVVSNIMDLTEEMKVLDKFAVTKNYITMKKKAKYYSLVNAAMTELHLSNPSFQNELYEKYFPERAAEPFTKEETDYCTGLKHSLKVAVYTDRKPVCYYDSEQKKYRGIAIDLANKLAKHLGIDFEYLPITTKEAEDMLQSVDLVMPVAKNSDADKYFTTRSLFDSEICMAVRLRENSPQKGDKIGVLKNTNEINNVLEQKDYQIVRYSSNEEAFSALQNGEIKAYANAGYIINWLLENPRYEGISELHYLSVPIEYLLCGKTSDEVLCSALDKGISALTNEDVEEAVSNNAKFNMDDLTLKDRIFMYRYVILLAGLISLLILLITLIYSYYNRRYIREIKEKGRAQEEAANAKSDFLSRMSHDMRTPMNAIIGMSYLGLKSESFDELKDYHEKINQSGKYLLGLINDTLDMSKMDSDKMELHPEPYLSKEFVESIRVMFAEKIKEKNIDLSIHINEQSNRALMFDKLRLQQIFVNLINNAIKFSEQDGKVSLDIAIDDVNDSWVSLTFMVADHGCGMTEEFQKKMYEPFEQGDSPKTDNETGTGLGLSIVKRLVELMGGTIYCQSKPGEGTTFIVHLQAKQYQGEMITEDSKDNENNASLEGKRVLLCEDHPLNVQIAVKLLESVGMCVDIAENGEIGLQKFEQSAKDYYQIILMDIRMPVMDGLTAASKIRSLDREDADKISIIAMTANAFSEDVEKSKEAGMNAHLAKPIDTEIFYRTLRKYCS